jgi:inosine/xanthosine triphosphatase
MTHVVVGSTNEGKVIACRRAFRRAFGEVEVSGIAVPSGVAEQPRGDECFVGARNRAEAVREAAKALSMPADYAVGIEGGMVKLHDRWFGFSAACVVDCSNGRAGYGTSPMFELPAANHRQPA